MTPVWAADYEHCYFADPSVNWTDSLETDPSTGVVSFNSTAHRKIRLYQDLGNGIDSGGHGTHTMGSLLGQPLNTSDLGSLDYRQSTATCNPVLLSPCTLLRSDIECMPLNTSDLGSLDYRQSIATRQPCFAVPLQLLRSRIECVRARAAGHKMQSWLWLAQCRF